MNDITKFIIALAIIGTIMVAVFGIAPGQVNTKMTCITIGDTIMENWNTMNCISHMEYANPDCEVIGSKCSVFNTIICLCDT